MMKISFALVAVLSLAGAGCKKGGGDSGGGDCTGPISKGVDRMAAARGAGKELPPDTKAKMDDFTSKMKGVIIKRCTDDKWPADVINCFDGVASRPDMMKCQGMLPQDQQDRVRNEVRELMMAGGLGQHGMGGGMGMHGMHGGMGGSDQGGSGAPAGSGDPGAGGAPKPDGSAAAVPAPTAPAAGSAK